MRASFRTDLAAEAHAQRLGEGELTALPGVRCRAEERRGFSAEVVEVLDARGEKELCKPIGRYVTLTLEPLRRREEDAFRRGCQALAEELRRQLALDGGHSVLVAGLGNEGMTPDAVGPLAAAQVIPTRHLKERLPEEFGAFRSVSVLRPGVLGTTGLESAALVRAACAAAAPDRILCIDALAAADRQRLCRSVQIADSGIVPGSGVGNAREALNRDTLGVPVVAVGVPTVVDASHLWPEEAEGFFVTPRDIDARVREAARLVGYGVNMALHPGMTVEDVDAFLN